MWAAGDVAESNGVERSEGMKCGLICGEGFLDLKILAFIYSV